jgi:large subunit ribosomal protein L3
LLGFAGYKVGMTHVLMVDDHKDSPTEGKEIMVPVTIIEIPTMKVAAIRAYSQDTYGKHAFTEIWAEPLDSQLSRRVTVPKNYDSAAAKKKFADALAANLVAEIYAVAYTQPATITGVPKKVPDIMEIKIAGGDCAKQYEFALGVLGKEIRLSNVIESGAYADITAITIGKGTQGPAKRWGVSLRKRKHSVGGKERHVGTLGPWNPHHVRWQVPQSGQMGFQQRTEFNKRILKIGENGAEITPDGGFLNYGVLRSAYVVIKGSIPGPAKRLIRIRPAIRQGEHVVRSPSIQFVSVQSKQG